MGCGHLAGALSCWNQRHEVSFKVDVLGMSGGHVDNITGGMGQVERKYTKQKLGGQEIDGSGQQKRFLDESKTCLEPGTCCHFIFNK
jgi:hypothetical protein